MWDDRRRHLAAVAWLAAATLLVSGCAPSATPTPTDTPTSGTVSQSAPSPATSGTPELPTPQHTLVVVMENHGYDSVIGNPQAPWVNALPAAVMTNWHAVAHPSQPNYLALFTGSTHGVTDDHCPVTVTGPNLASQLQDAGKSFVGYSEGLPAAGAADCRTGNYARKHNPWVDVPGLPAAVNQPLSALPSDFSTLPTVAFVIPDLCHDTHDCSIATGDAWLRDTLDRYLTWAQSHDSLLVITYDEDESDNADNRIPTLFAGPMVRPGRYDARGTHYSLLRTIEALHGLPGIGQAADATPLTAVWQ